VSGHLRDFIGGVGDSVMRSLIGVVQGVEPWTLGRLVDARGIVFLPKHWLEQG
jgi:hypothetical protein